MLDRPPSGVDSGREIRPIGEGRARQDAEVLLARHSELGQAHIANAEGDRAQAEFQFAEVEKAGNYLFSGMFTPSWAHLLLKRFLDDSLWPPWIPIGNEGVMNAAAEVGRLPGSGFRERREEKSVSGRIVALGDPGETRSPGGEPSTASTLGTPGGPGYPLVHP
jgi:hypothetical protein